MKKYLIVLIIISWWNNSDAQDKNDSESLSLEQVWNTVDVQNKNLKLDDIQRKQSDLDIEIAKDRRIPSLSVSGNYGLNTHMPIYSEGLFSAPDFAPVSKYGYSFGYLFNLNLYNGGKDTRNIQIKKEESIRSQNEYDVQRNNIRYAVAVAYYDLYKFLQFQEFIESEITTEKKQLATIESLFKNGTVLKSDVLRINVKLSQLELTRSDIDKKISIAKQRLNVFMGRHNEEPLSIPYKDAIDLNALTEDSDYMEYVNLALTKSPDFKITENNINIGLLNIKQVRSNILPKVSLYSSYNYTYPQTSFYPYSQNLWGFGQTGLKVSLSLDQLYTNKHAVEKARNSNDEQIQKMEIKKDALTVDIKEAFLQQQQSFEGVETAEKNITQTSESVRIIRNSYLNQESLLTDLLDAENILLEAKFSLISANINVILSHLRLLVKTGII